MTDIRKEEWVHLHVLLATVKIYCEKKCMDCNFEEYNDLGIKPIQVHRSAEDHQKAIYALLSGFPLKQLDVVEEDKRVTFYKHFRSSGHPIF